MFKLYDCDVGIKYNGVKYEFPNVSEVQIEDPERNQLTRGADAKDEVGLAYKDGLKEPKRLTVPIMQMNAALLELFKDLYKNQGRFEWYCVARSDGSSRWAKNAILSNMPRQLTLDESAESLNVSIEIVTFKLEDILKS